MMKKGIIIVGLCTLGLICSTESFNVYIDGSAGTTGLQVRDRLSSRNDINILLIPDDLRKDEGARKEVRVKSGGSRSEGSELPNSILYHKAIP